MNEEPELSGQEIIDSIYIDTDRISKKPKKQPNKTNVNLSRQANQKLYNNIILLKTTNAWDARAEIEKLSTELDDKILYTFVYTPEKMDDPRLYLSRKALLKYGRKTLLESCEYYYIILKEKICKILNRLTTYFESNKKKK